MSTIQARASDRTPGRLRIPTFVEAKLTGERSKAALLISLAAGFVLIIIKQIFADNFPLDFAYFHAAGRTWAAGMDPYGPAYAHFALPYIPKESALWAYPPQWWGITVALAALDMTSAVVVWKTAGLLAVMAGGALLFDVFRVSAGRAWIVTSLIFSVVLSSSDATWIPLHIGQTSPFMLFGFALLLHGLKYGGEKRMALGLVILLLKPPFGLFFTLLSMVIGRGRRPALAAVALSALACLPIVFSFGLEGTADSAFRFLSGLSSYETLSWNKPGSLTGAGYLAAVLGLPFLPTIATIVLAWIVTIWLCRKGPNLRVPPDPVSHFLVGLAVFYALVPLHNYDLILMPVFLLLLPELKAWAGCFVALALLSTWRVGSLAFAIYGEQLSSWMPGVYLAAFVQAGVGTLAVLLVLGATLFGRRPGNDVLGYTEA